MQSNNTNGNARFIRAAAVWSGIGAIVGAAIAVAAAFIPQINQNTVAVAAPREIVLAALHVLLLVGLVGLWRSGALGEGILAKISFVVAVLSRAILVVAELTVIFDLKTSNMIFGIATPVQGLGMIGLGICVLTTRRWRGWHLITPLVCGLYAFLVLLPSFAVGGGPDGGPNFFAIGGWSVAFLFLSIALWQEATAPQTTTATQLQSTATR